MIKSRSRCFFDGSVSIKFISTADSGFDFRANFLFRLRWYTESPEFVTGDMPNYPEAAKADRTSGWVDVEYLISPQGETSSISVIASSPSGVFDEAALEAVATWRFRVIGIELDQLQMKRISRLVFKLED